MVFRLPTHLESFIPPPSSQISQSRPWRGTMIVSGMRPSDRSSNQELRVTAVETDGDNRADLWPTQFFSHITHGQPLLRDVQEWAKHNCPPICTFMPDRLRDPNANTVNQTTFRSLSRMLFESQTVAIAPWGTEALPGAGIIIFPAANSSSLLVGALFLASPFPDFIVGAPSSTQALSPTAMHSRHHQYQQQPSISPSSSYASSSRHAHAHAHVHSNSPHRSIPNTTSPIEQPISGHRQDHYRYIMPRNYSDQASAQPLDGWPAVKDEDEAKYTGFTHENPQYQ